MTGSPSAFSRRTKANIFSSTSSGDRPSDGSSRISSRGSAIMPQPMASICCSPPDSVLPCPLPQAREGAEHAVQVQAAVPRRHVHRFAQGHGRLHHVLDHQDGHAAVADGADLRQNVADLRRVEAGQHLVQQQLRLRRQGARQLQPLAARDGQGGGRAVQHRPHPHAPGRRVGPRHRLRAARVAEAGADRDVLTHGQPGEGPHDLEGAGDAAARAGAALLG